MPNENFSTPGESSTQDTPTTAVPDRSGGTLTDREIIQATTPQDQQATPKQEQNTETQKYEFEHDKLGHTAATNHIKAEQNPEPQPEQKPAPQPFLSHDINGTTAATNHIKTEQNSKPQKYEFEHDINGTTAATNHIKTEQKAQTQPEEDSKPEPILAHDINGTTAATNHIKQEESSNQQTNEIEKSRRQSDEQMLREGTPKDSAYVHKVLDNNQRRFASLDDANKQDNTQMFVRESHIDKVREEMEKDFAEREAKQPELTPKQKLAETERRFAQLTTLRRKNSLTEEEKTEYLNLLNERELLEEQMENGEVEVEKSGGEEMEKRKKVRDSKKIALIAGVVAGGATGIVGGVPVASVGIIATAVARLGTYATDKLSARNINYLQNELKNEAEEERKALLEKRLSKWNKVVKITQHINEFLRGAGYGFTGSSVISGLLMGGKGIAEALAARREAATVADMGNPADGGQVGENVTNETPSPEPQNSGSIETPPRRSGSIEMPNKPLPSIPDTLPFDQYPLLRDGLIARGMDPARAGGALRIAEGTASGWMARQREVVEMINSLGYKLNSKAAGFTIGEIVGNNRPVTAGEVESVFSQAAASLGN